jgi:hypothetical protein
MVCGNRDGWGQIGVSQGNRIEATFGEGMAAGEAAESKPGAFEDAEPNESYVGVLRAGREIEALGGADCVEERREDGVVDAVGSADGEAGLGILHFAKRLAAAVLVFAAFPPRFVWHERR